MRIRVKSQFFTPMKHRCVKLLPMRPNLPMFSSKKVVVLKRAEILDKNSIELVNRYSLSRSLHTRLILVSGESSKPNMKLTQGIFIKDVGRSSKKDS